jgi:hyperosmotically inducible periplasmic protein
MTRRVCCSLLLILALASVSLAADKQPITDDSIYDAVRMKLANDQVVKGGALQVDVKGGVVTLSGTVQIEQQKARATKLTSKIKGVKSVVNNISLRADKPGK